MEPGLIISILSAIFLVVGVKLWQKGNNLMRKGKRTKAIVFKNNFKRSGSSGGVYYPVVRFTTETNEWITQELSIGYFPAKAEGTQIEVIYDPAEPSHVEINTPFQLEIFPRLLVVIGICGFFWGVLKYLEFINIL